MKIVDVAGIAAKNLRK